VFQLWRNCTGAKSIVFKTVSAKSFSWRILQKKVPGTNTLLYQPPLQATGYWLRATSYS
jgi:hypothetical protein